MLRCLRGGFFLFQSVHNLERPYADLFGTSDGEDKPPHERTKSKLITHYGWYHILNIVTDNDPFKEEELMKWNVRRLLNRLMYLKDKASIEAWEAELKNERHL